MIDLYAMGSPNVAKIYIALEEAGVPLYRPGRRLWRGAVQTSVSEVQSERGGAGNHRS